MGRIVIRIRIQKYVNLAFTILYPFSLFLMVGFTRFLRLVLCLALLASCYTIASAQQMPADTLNEAPQRPFPVADSVGLPGSGPNKALSEPWNRTAIVADYYQNYLGSAVSNAQLGWTGSVTACIPGSISQLAQDRTLQRINYYRRLVGLPDNTTFDAGRNAATQATALMMVANNALSHAPPASWLCYTALGATGAGSSNLGLGSHSSQAVKQYIDDGGAGNTAVGHRRWILYSRAGSFGHGNVVGSTYGFADALWVFNTPVTPPFVPPYVAFPPAGYVPRTLIPPRWSFSLPDANFSAASVAVQNQQGTALSITKHALAANYGDNTLVWDLNTAADLTWTGSADKSFRVTVSGVSLNGVTQPPYSYTVVAIDAEAICPGPTPVAACTPTVSGGMSNFYGTEVVRFNTIDRLSSAAGNDGRNYTDITCSAQTTVTAGNSYSLSVQGYFTNTHALRVWIDFNGNGNFTDSGELVLTASANSASAIVTIPPTAALNTPLRMRVLADSPSSAGNSCAITGGGQIDDYAVWVLPTVCNLMATTQHGAWTNPAIWSCGRVPVITDRVQIGHLVTIGAGITAQTAQVSYLAGGRLTFGADARLQITP